jgi:hypothetical protein
LAGPKPAGLVAQSKNKGTESSTAWGDGGRSILAATSGKVGWGGALGLHGAVGKWLEARRRRGLIGGAVSTGARLDQRGTAVGAAFVGGVQRLTV